MNKLKLAILKNETDDAHQMWVNACEWGEISFDIIDLTLNSWLGKLMENEYDYYLACPSATVSYFKKMYDERIYIVEKVLGLPVYPSYNEIVIHENKRCLSYWLKAQGLPHPETWVFYKKKEAIDFIEDITLLIVGKINIGASGKGVRIFKTRKNVMKYIDDAFSSRGIKQTTGPNLKMGNTKNRIIYALKNPSHIKKRLSIYKKVAQDSQRHFLIFQEFIPHEFEWRCVRIGGSYFAHKKIVKKEKASGSLLKGYESPPLKLLNFIRVLTEKTNLSSVAIDLFETRDRGYLVNEIQCIFGQSDPYQMLVDGKPGRYLYKNNKWIFEEGNFNTNNSYDLRLAHVIEILNRKKK